MTKLDAISSQQTTDYHLFPMILSWQCIDGGVYALFRCLAVTLDEVVELIEEVAGNTERGCDSTPKPPESTHEGI